MASLRLHPGFHDAPATRVLMLTHRVPFPPDRGDRIRAWHLLQQLSRMFDVSLACLADEPVSAVQYAELKRRTHRLAIRRIDPRTTRWRAAAALATGEALTPTALYRRDLAKQIIDWHHAEPFDAVLTYCTGMIRYARLLTNVRHVPRGSGFTPIRHVLDLVDVDSLKWKRYAETARAPMKWVYGMESRRLRWIEAGIGDWFDAVTVVSDAEAEAYRRDVGVHGRLHVSSNGVDTRYFFPLPDLGKPKIAFVGVLDYKPNVDGVCWFADEVLPLIAKRIPGVQLLVVGRNPCPRVRELGERHNVSVFADVPDVRKYLAKASAVVAPLHIAPGVQNKVLEAMASRRVVVCTPGSAAGIDAVAGEHLLVGEGVRHFAALTARVLGDAPFRQRIAFAARQRVEERYAWEAALSPMMDLLTGRPIASQARPESPLDALRGAA